LVGADVEAEPTHAVNQQEGKHGDLVMARIVGESSEESGF